MSKFKTKEDYLDWCEQIITKIYYANIAMNNEGIKETVSEIARKLHLTEGQGLYGEDG
tara:strand:+ start:1934 stop:2107 length:174 start_codon:yes stop_codon:yes gene_type:complete